LAVPAGSAILAIEIPYAWALSVRAASAIRRMDHGLLVGTADDLGALGLRRCHHSLHLDRHPIRGARPGPLPSRVRRLPPASVDDRAIESAAAGTRHAEGRVAGLCRRLERLLNL